MLFAISETKPPGGISVSRTSYETTCRGEEYSARKCRSQAGNCFLIWCPHKHPESLQSQSGGSPALPPPSHLTSRSELLLALWNIFHMKADIFMNMCSPAQCDASTRQAQQCFYCPPLATLGDVLPLPTIRSAWWRLFRAEMSISGKEICFHMVFHMYPGLLGGHSGASQAPPPHIWHLHLSEILMW